MNELMNLFTSKELVVAIIISVITFVFCFSFYIFEKSSEKRRKKHNTRELNKIVEQVQEEIEIKEVSNYSDEPVLQPIEVKEEEQVDTPLIVSTEEIVPTNPKVDEELVYTTIEPDQETAKLELQKLTEELRKQQESEIIEGEVNKNDEITTYEEQQEENAIISLEELINKGKDLYKNNELTQYSDEGNEPISLQELEAQGYNNKSYDEPFIIENVVPEEEINEVEKEAETIKPTVILDDFNMVSVKESTFKSSPIISPVFGIEKQTTNDLELENTANYEKLDEEIKRTNEFLNTLRELQSKLD